MQTHERAAQIWPVLALASRNRRILTYEIVGGLIGVPRQALGQLLEPIESYCLIHDRPALTALVVNASGLPGAGFIAVEDFPAEQHRVFSHEWLREPTPDPDMLREAVLQRPSCEKPEARHSDE